MDLMFEIQVRDFTHFPDRVEPIGCKWFFKLKVDKDGNICAFKARLMAQGFKHVHGFEYDETFLSVAMLKSIWILVAITAFYDYEISQLDVKTAFLNGSLKRMFI